MPGPASDAQRAAALQALSEGQPLAGAMAASGLGAATVSHLAARVTRAAVACRTEALQRLKITREFPRALPRRMLPELRRMGLGMGTILGLLESET